MEVVSEGPTHRFAGVGNVLVSVYWGAPTTEALRERIAWIERAIAAYPKFGLLVVVTPEAGGSLPGREFREESRAQAKRFEEHLAFSASVIEGRDLIHTLVRTFLRGLAVVVGKRVEVRFFESASDGAAWAAERAAPEGPDARALLEAIDALRP